MLKTTIALMAIMLLIPATGTAASSAKAVHGKVAKAVDVEAASQKQYDKWTEKRADESSEIRDMKAMDSWLEFQNKKYVKYIKKQETVIAELQRRKEEAKRIRMELEPYLEEVVAQLESFVAADLPFLQEERVGRIQFLHESLDDYRLALSEKLRRVFEALQVETEYGRNVSTDSVEMDLNGTPIRVSTFRLGRIALFYRTADGAEAGYWDKASGSWKAMDESYTRILQRAEDMAERKRAVELLDLPIGATR